MRRVLATTLAVALLTSHALAATQACDISTAMETSRQAERDRRLNDIDGRIQELNMLNDLMNACLNNFPSMPTDWMSGAAMTAAFQKVRQQVCEGLVQKAKSSYQQSLNDAQNAGNKALGGQMPNVGSLPNTTVPTSPTVSPQPASSSMINSVTENLKRFFQ